MKYRESEEMYLETILLLTQNNENVRSIDVANELNYSRASVSRAMGLLEERGYITFDSNYIRLTEEGNKKANEILERHELITKLLVKIGVDQNEAEENACRIEHVISSEVLAHIKEYLNKE